MKTSEQFALNQWLSDYPEDMSYQKIIKKMTTSKSYWSCAGIIVWEVVEDHPLDQVAEFIEDPRRAYERINTTRLTAEQLHEAASYLENKEGGFGNAIALAYYRADGDNQRKLVSAFSELFERAYAKWHKQEHE